VVADLLRGDWEPVPADLVNLALPRFSLESTIDLLPALAALGMITATTDGADFGDLSPEPLRVDQFTQQAVVDIDEEGVKAAAVTVVAMARAAGPRPDPVVLDLAFDRPFAFALVDPELGLPLFTGWVADPSGPERPRDRPALP
jgi:serpin B